jgi:hypothetical protein
MGYSLNKQKDCSKHDLISSFSSLPLDNTDLFQEGPSDGSKEPSKPKLITGVELSISEPQ